MSYTEFKATWYKKTATEPPTWESTGTDVTDLIRLKENEALSEGTKISKDGFNFEISNYDSDGDGFGNRPVNINVDDLIEIKFSRDGAAFVQVMSGVVTSVGHKIGVDGRFTDIKGANRTKSLLRAVFNITELNKTPDLLVAAILLEVNEFNNNAGLSNKTNFVYFDKGTITAFADAGGGQVTVTSATHGLVNGATVTITGTTNYNGDFVIANVTTNTFEITDAFAGDETGTWGSYKDQDGAAEVAANLTIQRQIGDLATQQLGTSQTDFSSISTFSTWFEEAYVQIQKISSREFNGDSNFIFYFDSQNSFYWLAKPDTISAVLSEGTDFTELEITKDSSKVVNLFIVHCGTGPDNAGIMTFASNEKSILDHGLQSKFLDRTQLADQVMRLEQQNNPGSFSAASFPFPSSYNYTMSYAARKAYQVGVLWYSPQGNDGNDGSTIALAKLSIVTTDDDDYAEAVSQECKARAETEGDRLLSVLGVSSFSANMELKGTTSYSKGNLLTLNVPSIGWIGDEQKNLRIHTVEHTFGSKGWVTDLKLEEDEETL